MSQRGRHPFNASGVFLNAVGDIGTERPSSPAPDGAPDHATEADADGRIWNVSGPRVVPAVDHEMSLAWMI